MLVVADLRALAAVDRDLDRYTLVGGASIYPFCWSVLLAARAEGLGGVMTTMASGARTRSAICWAFPPKWSWRVPSLWGSRSISRTD